MQKEIVHSNPYFQVVAARVKMPEGEILDPYYYSEYLRDSVAVVPIRSTQQVLLLKMWRPVSESAGWEIPAGVLEAGETPEEAARRELLEESGWEAMHIQALGWFHPSNATSAERIQLFVASDLQQRHNKPDAREVSSIRWHSAPLVKELIRTQEVRDGASLTGLLLAFQLGYINGAGVI